jgi:membrane protein DedA with SNARE-associated domain
MLNNFFQWLLEVTQGLGYLGVGILMTIESSFLPLPSEVVIPPAAFLASQGKMNLVIIILVGTLGSIIGALINYFLSRSLGRLVIYKLADTRLARLLLVTPEKIKKTEEYFLKNSKSATFFGRLIPVVRHLISIPAGFSKMPLLPFIGFTALGAFIWVSILAALGYFIGANQGLLAKYYQELSWGLLILGIIWLIYKIRETRRAHLVRLIEIKRR